MAAGGCGGSGMLGAVPGCSGIPQLVPAAGSGRAPGPVTAHVTARMAAVAGGWGAGRARRRRRRGRGEEKEKDEDEEEEGGPGTEAVLRRLREAR